MLTENNLNRLYARLQDGEKPDIFDVLELIETARLAAKYERDHRAMEVLRKCPMGIHPQAFTNGVRWGVCTGPVSVDSYHEDPATALLNWHAANGGGE